MHSISQLLQKLYNSTTAPPLSLREGGFSPESVNLPEMDPLGVQTLSKVINAGLSKVGMNPNDIEGVNMALGILGAGSGIPQASSGATIPLGSGIGPGIMRGLKDKDPAKYAEWLKLFMKKEGFDPHAPMQLLRSQQENTNIPVSFGGRLATFFTPASRKNVAGYNNNIGATEGGPFDVSAIANMKNPLIIREGTGFIGDRGVRMFSGGGTTRDSGPGYGKQFLADTAYPISQANKVKESLLPRQALSELSTARDKYSAVKEAVLTAYANKAGHDYIVKVRPDINKPTQILHTDLKAVNANKRKYLEDQGMAPGKKLKESVTKVYDAKKEDSSLPEYTSYTKAYEAIVKPILSKFNDLPVSDYHDFHTELTKVGGSGKNPSEYAKLAKGVVDKYLAKLPWVEPKKINPLDSYASNAAKGITTPSLTPAVQKAYIPEPLVKVMGDPEVFNKIQTFNKQGQNEFAKFMEGIIKYPDTTHASNVSDALWWLSSKEKQAAYLK